MAIIKFVFYIAIMLFFLVLGLTFTLRNQIPLTVDLLIVQSSSATSGFWVLGSLLAGVIIGLLIALPGRLTQAFKIRNLSKIKTSKVNNIPSGKAKTDALKG
jgi:uncharacterized integral membrane protein